MSTERTGRPSRCAAMPRMAPSAVTPCPPTPASRMFQAPSSPGSGSTGSGSSPAGAARGVIRRLRRLGAHQRDEGGAEAVARRRVLVAGALVDAALAAEGASRPAPPRGSSRCGSSRRNPRRRAVLMTARRLGLGRQVALALAAALGGAFLVVDQDGDARRLAQLALHRIQFGAVVEGDALRHPGAPRWRSGSSETTAMPATPSAAICAAICGTPISPSGVWPPVMATALLTRILKVMVGLGGHGGADRQAAGMGVGAVAHIGEDVPVARRSASCRARACPRRPSG